MAGGFLPPEPPGPEPDFGGRPKEPPSPRQPAPPPEQPQWQQPPPGYWQPQSWQPPGPAEPDNGPAVAGFVLGVVGAGVLVLSVGLLAFVSLVLAILGIVYARRGKRKVESGATRRHQGLAQAGFVTSIVTLVVAAPLTLLEIVFLILYASDEEFREDFEDELDDSLDESPASVTVVRLALPILRGVADRVA
jgi:hypothetical protein